MIDMLRASKPDRLVEWIFAQYLRKTETTINDLEAQISIHCLSAEEIPMDCHVIKQKVKIFNWCCSRNVIYMRIQRRWYVRPRALDMRVLHPAIAIAASTEWNRQ